MEVKKIAVCGDSYMCLDKLHVGTHFSELLNSRYSVVNLARAGVSHVEIGFQIKQAIELNPDYVFIGSTTSDRIEVPIADTKNIESLKLEHFRSGPDRYYLSSNILTLINSGTGYGEFKPYLTDDIVDALKKHLLYIHDDRLMKEINSWIIGYWLNQLCTAGIPHYLFDDTFAVYSEQLMSPIYHTSYKTQVTAAEWINNHLGSIFKG